MSVRYLLLIILMLVCTPFVMASLSMGDVNYVIGDDIVIFVNTDTYEHPILRIYGPETYRYVGSMNEEITFTPKLPGQYFVQLQDQFNTVKTEQLIFNVAIDDSLDGSLNSNLDLVNDLPIEDLINDSEYSITSFNNSNNFSNVSDSFNYSFNDSSIILNSSPISDINDSEINVSDMNRSNDGGFDNAISDYDVSDYGDMAESNELNNKTSSPVYTYEKTRDVKLITNKEYYAPGELIVITSKGDYSGLSLQLRTPTKLLKHLGSFNFPLIFSSYEVGTYYLELREGFNIVSRTPFYITESPEEGTIFFKTSEGELLNIKEAKFIDDSFEVIPDSSIVKKIKFENIELGKHSVVGLDEVPSTKIDVEKKTVHKAYAINTDQLNFTNGTVVSEAVGTELYKCAEWNFTTQTCMGSWKKFMDITPGQDYNFSIYPGDPGYAETGLATINTNKSLYHPGETAELRIVVLDQFGFLSEANIELTINDPNNQQTTYYEDMLSTDNITYFNQTSKGVYTLKISNLIIGDYSLFVRATGDLVNHSMITSFSVKDDYPFDIIRIIPDSIDPWKGSFNVSILINEYVTGTFDFTEEAPAVLNITAPDATVLINGSKQYLTWTNLVGGSIINYSVRAPLKTPDLHVFGPAKITYDVDKIFVELRPWYLAVDPEYDPTESQDVAIAALDDHTFVIAYVDISGNPDVSFQVIDANGTILVTETDVFTSTIGTNGRVDIAVINSTRFGIAYYEGSALDLNYHVYDRDGTSVNGPHQVDGAGVTNADIAIANIGDRFAFAWTGGGLDLDGEMWTYTGTMTQSEFNIDGRMESSIMGTLWDITDIAVPSYQRWVPVWFDKRNGNNIRASIYGTTSTNLGSTVVASTGADSQLTATALSGELVVVAYYDSALQDILFRIYNVSGDSFTSVVGPVTVDTDAGTLSRLDVSELIHNDQSYFVITYFDQAADTIEAAIYNASGSKYNNFTVTAVPDATYRLLSVTSADSFTGTNLCNSTFLVAYTNNTNSAVYEKFFVDGSTWSGICAVPTINFVPPTLVDKAMPRTNWTEINISFSEADLINFSFNWNGSNQVWMGGDLGLLYNFNNLSVLGESDSLIKDLSGNGRDGTSDATYASGVYDTALSCNGSSDVTFDSSFNLGTNDWTIAFWYKEDVDAQYDSVLAKGTFNGVGDLLIYDYSQPGYHLVFRSDNALGGGIGNSIVISANDLQGTGWHHIAVTRIGDTIRTYLDNSLIDSANTITSNYNFNNAVAWSLCNRAGGTDIRHMDMDMDDLYILTTGFDDSEIQDLYNTQLTKYDLLNWNYYLNKTNLVDGDYTYDACVGGKLDEYACTETRTLTIGAAIPLISNIQCESGTWKACDSLNYNDTITQIRADCVSTSGNPIKNLTFNLTNIDDNKLLILNTTTDNSTGSWVANITDTTLIDSGDFNLHVLCQEDSFYAYDDVAWNFAWGTLSSQLVTPSSNTEVVQNWTFDFITRVICSGGECGDISGTAYYENKTTSNNWPIPTINTTPYSLIWMDFESSDFTNAGRCGTTASYQCAANSPWDDFTDCQEGSASYMCASTEADSGGSGTRGLECRGCDRNDADNNGGLYIDINSTPCGGKACQSLLFSYYQVVESMNNVNEGSAVFVADDDGVWRLVSNCMDGDPNCDANTQGGSRATMGSYAELVQTDLCTIIGIDCNQALKIYFTSYNILEQGTGDYFGWDQINLTGYDTKVYKPGFSSDPFYTLAMNPQTSTPCLQDMIGGTVCDTTWLTNATGPVDTTWSLFASYEPLSYIISETNTSKVDVTIRDELPPLIEDLACYNGAWVDCTTLSYGDSLSAVRVNCTPRMLNPIVNVSFMFMNVDDDALYFNINTTNKSGGFYYYNFSDIILQDSGDFDLNISCYEQISNSLDVTWFIPWGVLSSQLVNPTTDKDVPQNLFFSFSSKITCSGGECGEVNASLIAEAIWWDSSWDKRIPITITANDTLSSNYTINVTIDSSDPNFQNDCDDIRVVYFDGTTEYEVDRYVVGCGTNNTGVYFSLYSPISSGNSAKYFIYYNNSAASNPPNNLSKIFIYGSDFESGTEGWTVGGQSYNWARNNIFSGTLSGCGSADCYEPSSAFGGSYSWGTDFGNPYFGDSNSWGYVRSPEINLSNYASNNLTLSYATFWQLEGGSYDQAQVLIASDPLFTTNLVTVESMNPGPSCDASGCVYSNWSITTYDVSNYDNNLSIEFRFESDSTLEWSGLYFDFVTVRLSTANKPSISVGGYEKRLSLVPSSYGIKEGYYPITFMDFDSPNDFPQISGACPTTATYQCAATSPWYNFDDCQDSGGAYGMCSSTDAGVSGSRGFECVGCDRSDSGNNGGLYIDINNTACGGQPCYSLNISYYQVVESMDNANEGSAVFVADDDNVWTLVSNCMDGDPDCDCNVQAGCSRANMGQYAEFVSADLCSISGINCSQNLSVFFTSYNILGHGTIDYFAWDEINVTGSLAPVNKSLIFNSSFYTVNENAMTSFTNLCLGSLKDGDSCNAVWSVNATGDINTTWKFSVLYEPITYSILSAVTNQVNITIVDYAMPQISNVQCNLGSGWTDCTTISYHDTVQEIRADCVSQTGENITSVDFKLYNVQDNNTLFSVNTTDNSSGHWYVDITDIYINDSGDFELEIGCSESIVRSKELNSWLIPWGVLTPTIISPNTNANVIKNRFFNFTAQISCTGGECNNVTAILDPMTAYPLVWMDFENSPDFGRLNSTCPTTDPNYQCTLTNPWDDFTDCQDPNGDYGMCSSSDGATNGNYGFECVGCDRADSGNNGGLYIDINNTACDGQPCESINISYYQVVESMDNANEGSAVFVADDDNVWTLVSRCIDGDPNCDCNSQTGCSRSTMGQYAEFVSTDLCSISGINCSQNLSIYFTAYLLVAEGPVDFFAWDDINITGYRHKGTIPMNSGFPFYTTTSNPMAPNDNGCLNNMGDGTTCTTEWSVNATGLVNSTWPFFIIYLATTYPDQGISVNSSVINITIVDNAPPNISSINLVPEFPLNSDDLNCSFIVNDRDTFDSYWANISWYRNDTYYSSSYISVQKNILYSSILNNVNTNIGDRWLCQITPSDIDGVGIPRNSSEVTVAVTTPPVIQNIECQLEGVTWTSCSNALFGSNITAVRATITDDGSVNNATFMLYNREDNYTFFINSTSSGVGNVFTINNSDIFIQDSGTFDINVTSYDDLGYARTVNSTWFIPFGVINVSWNNILSELNVTRYQFTNFSVNVTCTGGECGNFSILLDPLSPFVIANMDFESNTDFPLDANQCGTGVANQCAATSPWDDYTDCQDSGGAYGYCASLDADAIGSRGLECVGCDRTDAGNNGGLYITINQTSCGGKPCESVNISYYQGANSLDNANEGSAVYVSDDDGTLRLVSDCMNGEACESSSRASMGASAEYIEANLCEISGIDCTQNLSIFFTSKNAWSHGTGDFFMWDNILVTGYAAKGLIPMNSGYPFYTTTSNPMTSADNNCLVDLTNGDLCTITWSVNATGEYNSTHTFFAYTNATTYSYSPDYTANITVMIVGNQPPTVSGVTLVPSPAQYLQNLTCGFTVNDPNTFDSLFANVTWYRNGTYYSSSLLSVTNNNPVTTILHNSNTAVNDVWSCGVSGYDGTATGSQVNSSNVSIVLNFPPELKDFACESNESVWLNCSDIGFDHNLTRVRANCSSTIGVSNVTFEIWNTHTNELKYKDSTTSTELGYYVLDIISNQTINRSGVYAINATCTDVDSVSVSNSTSWLVDYGTLLVSLVNPTINTYVQQNEFFNFSVNLTCQGGTCGNVSLALDPINHSVVYNYSSGFNINKWAYEVDSNNNPPTSINTRNTLSSADATAISISDNSRWISIDPGNGDYVSLELINKLDQSNVNKLTYYFEGNPQNNAVIFIYAWNFSSSSWVEVASKFMLADTDDTLEGSITSGLSDFINSSNHVRWNIFHQDTSDLFRVDYLELNVTYSKGLISTTPGMKPFYTTINNPMTSLSCLDSMTKGDTCNLTWFVNATGELSTTHEFFSYANSTTESAYVPIGESNHILITISNQQAIPPTIILNAPEDNVVTSNTSIDFNCSATDNLGLSSIALYANFSGTFTQVDIDTVSGLSNSSLFTRSLAEGKYIWNCLGKDTDNNINFADNNYTLIIDTTPPTINLIKPIAGAALNDENVTINFTVTDNFDSQMICNLTIDGNITDQNFVANNGVLVEFLKTGLSPAMHYWNVTCIDDANNKRISETRNFTLADIPPSVNLVTQDNLFTTGTQIVLEYIATDNYALVNSSLILNGVVNASSFSVDNGKSENYTLTNVAEGYYNWTILVYDTGNLSSQAIERFFTVDNTAPSIALFTPPNNFITSSGLVQINFTATDNLDTNLNCNITSNGTVVDMNFNATNGTLESRTVVMPDGITNWNVSCRDRAGNQGFSTTRTINITQAPQITLISPPDEYGQTFSEVNLVVRPWDNDGISKCDLYINGLYNRTNSTPITNNQSYSYVVSSLSEGRYNWSVLCEDINGNQNQSEIRDFMIDTHAPVVNTISPDGDTLLTKMVQFNFTATDNLAQILFCNLTIDGVDQVTNYNATNGVLTTINVTGLTETLHYWNVTCWDPAGNYNYSDIKNVTVLTPPDVTLLSPADGAFINSSNISLIYYPEDNDDVTGAILYINGIMNQSVNPLSEANNTFNLTNLAEGNYTWMVSVNDSLNLRTNSTTWSFTVDLSPPTILVHQPINNQIMDWNYVHFNYTITDTYSSQFTCNVTVNDVLEYTNLLITNGTLNEFDKPLRDGNYNWSIYCLDEAGNSQNTGLINFSVVAPPIIDLNFPKTLYRTNLVDITLNYTPNDYYGLENCTLNINNAVNQTDVTIDYNVPNYFTLNNLVNGFYNWSVSCIDADPDLNYGISNNETFYIDLTPPSLTFINPLNNTILNNDDVSFLWNATDYSGSLVTCNISIDGSLNQSGVQEISGDLFNVTRYNMTDGPHNWSLSCWDDLNNTITSSTYNFIINQPDLIIEQVYWNQTNPDVLENITLYINVSNFGGIPANNIFVEAYDGFGGSVIGNTTIPVVDVNDSKLTAITWLVTEGFHNIHVAVDPYNTIGELNDSNNNASINISTLVAYIDAPQSGLIFNNSNVNLSLRVADYYGSTVDYRLFVNGGQDGSGTANDNISFIYTVTRPDGIYDIYIEAEDSQTRVKQSSTINITIDTTPPVTNFLTPNNTFYPTTNISLEFNLTDQFSTNISYRLFIDGSLNITGSGNASSLVEQNITGVTEGVHKIIIETTDEVNNYQNSTEWTIVVDLTPPNATITTFNNTWFNVNNPLIDFILTDNLDYIINYTLYVDDLFNTSGVANNNTPSSDNLVTLNEGSHQIILGATDEALHKYNSTPITINVDYTPPHINLEAPSNGLILSSQNVTFNFTVTDNLDNLLECTLYVSGENSTQVNVTDGAKAVINYTGVNYGTHTWNVSCTDNTGNINVSETWSFDIPVPDLVITSGNITFSNYTPIENQTVVVNATIFNIGNSTAYNFDIQFWLGDPLAGGSLIDTKSITSLPSKSSTILSINHTALIGQNDIYVLVDTPLSSNGSIPEINESNNKAANGFQVGLYNIFSGLSNNLLNVDNSLLNTLFQWNVTNGTGDSIIVADIDSTLTFANLTALSRDVSSTLQLDDFTDLDTQLNSINLSDSINNTWRSPSGALYGTDTFTIFKHVMSDVPVINSTNTTNFITGILWDADDGGLEYDGTQDVAFISKLNRNKQGGRGIYDYEIKIPATLRGYRGVDDRVVFYAEIK